MTTEADEVISMGKFLINALHNWTLADWCKEIKKLFSFTTGPV